MILDLILHVDKYLNPLIATYGLWVYLILFLIIFIETGLVFMPFLPGDSLLFVAGTLAGSGLLSIPVLCISLVIAAIVGDSLNYWIGKCIGLDRIRSKFPKILKKEYFDATSKFYEKHGSKTIIMARFTPYIRSFAPFMAGVGLMQYPRFLVSNVIGGTLWVLSFTLGGYFFGGLPVVKENFGLVIWGIIILSIVAVIFILLGATHVVREQTKNK